MENNEVNKLDMKSANIIGSNIEKIAEMFPSVVKEGKIDFIALKQELTNDLIDEKKEKYQLTWAGKRQSVIEANTQINKTLIPLKEKSINYDNTKNIYIEGDNLEVLKILQESYLNKIKCIYIDPPYNTGKDFIYNDKFADSLDDELNKSGQADEYNNKLISNTESNGRFHSDWLSMMYSRLKLSRNLLTNDGLIFISIGREEETNLEKICDEIFGENSKIGVIVQEKGNAQNDATNIQNNHDYILVYTRGKVYEDNKEKSVLYEEKIVKVSLLKDNNGDYYYLGSGIVTGGEGGTLSHRPNLGYTIYYNPNTDDKIAVDDYDKNLARISNNEDEVYKDDENLISKGYVAIRPPKKGKILGAWTWSLEKFNAEKNLISISKNKDTYSVRKKEYVNKEEVVENDDEIFIEIKKKQNIKSVWNFNSASGTTALSKILGEKVFNNPKNVDMLKYIFKIANTENEIILDFFSGSATSAEAVMRLNDEDNGNRRFIMVQLPEKADGRYEYICDIGEDRIKKVAKEIKNNNVDYGFRVYKVESSNMKDVYYEPSKLNQTQLNMFDSNIKEDRTSEDLLTQVILDLGLTLDLRIEEKNILNNKVYFVAENSLVACFDNQINIDILNQICEIKPLKVVFRESSFRNDSDKINAYERIKKLSPETEISVI